MSGGIVIIGAGIGGLVAAAELAAAGCAVTVVEALPHVGGKLRTVDVAGAAVDAGPTVFTARWLFDDIFASLGERLDDHLTLVASDCLATHAWGDGSRLDLWADPARSRDAVGSFAGAAEARGWDDFQAEAKRIWDALETRYMMAPVTTPWGLTARFGLSGLPQMLAINPFQTLWAALHKHFRDPRLIQLYGRYATYCGASPFQATATLMLIAHLEARGVWLVDGGMHKVAEALARLAVARGATLRLGERVTGIATARGRVSGVVLASGEMLPARDVIANCDVSAIADGRFGAAASSAAPGVRAKDRSLSAVVTLMVADVGDAALDRHNVFFSDDYAAEFRQIFGERRLPAAPSVYVCAQDRGAGARPTGPERFQLIVNAPAIGDALTPEEIEACQLATLRTLSRCGLDLRPQAQVVTTPATFETLFPSTGGALYGRASHGWAASFRRPGSRTKLPGLWLAGGSAHPGAGVPMAALSGRLASAAILADRRSMRSSHPMATAGGISTRSAATAASG
ncbi:CrtD protein [alpha proteobacterium AAP81b]|nr:CrtD protein [alpha proteobacterium AAP81b]